MIDEHFDGDVHAAAEIGHQVSMVVVGDFSRTARMTSTKCWAPPSRRSSRSTLVITHSAT